MYNRGCFMNTICTWAIVVLSENAALPYYLFQIFSWQDNIPTQPGMVRQSIMRGFEAVAPEITALTSNQHGHQTLVVPLLTLEATFTTSHNLNHHCID